MEGSPPPPRGARPVRPAFREEGLARNLGTSWDAETGSAPSLSAAGSWESFLWSLAHVAGRQRTCCAF